MLYLAHKAVTFYKVSEKTLHSFIHSLIHTLTHSKIFTEYPLCAKHVVCGTWTTLVKKKPAKAHVELTNHRCATKSQSLKVCLNYILSFQKHRHPTQSHIFPRKSAPGTWLGTAYWHAATQLTAEIRPFELGQRAWAPPNLCWAVQRSENCCQYLDCMNAGRELLSLWRALQAHIYQSKGTRIHNAVIPLLRRGPRTTCQYVHTDPHREYSQQQCFNSPNLETTQTISQEQN